MTSTKNFVFSAFWSVGVQILSLIIVLASNIFLARKLSPDEIGSFGIIMPFIAIANIFADGSLSSALVRKKEVENEDYSTVFVFNIIISVIFTAIFVIISGFIAEYYNNPLLKWLLIVATSVIIISAFQIVQNAKLVIAMRFKEKSLSILFSTILGVSTGLFFAYVLEMGVWSLIAIPIITNFFLAIFYGYYAGFFFNLHFSKKSFKSLYAFGINTTLASVLNILMNNIYQLVLGRTFSISQVGFFYQAKKLNDVPIAIVNNLSQGVVYSGLSKVYGDDQKIYRTYSILLKFFVIVLGFVSAFIFVFASDIIEILFTNKWLGSVFYLQFLSIASFFYCQELINKVIFKLYDKTKVLLRLEVVKNVIQIIGIGIGIYLEDIKMIIYLYVITAVISYFINYYATKSILKTKSNYEQLIMLVVFFIASISAASLVYLKTIFNITSIHVVIFIVIYVFLLFIFRILKVSNIKEVVNVVFKRK